MAAYAALVSLMHIIDNLQLHPCPPISLHNKQLLLLTQKVNSLLELLEGYNPHLGYNKEADPLESRIADAAYAAEDAIESHMVDRITGDGKKMMSSDGSLYEAVEKVIEEMGLIEKEAMEIKVKARVQYQLHRNSKAWDSLRYPSMAQKSSMVGADDVLLQMMDKLTADCLDLQIIPIVGMGGTGKTTLARNIYKQRLIKEHFYISAWATISQEYSIQEILREVFCQLNNEVGQQLSEVELGEMLYKYLFGRKYLIIMDDMWSIDVWDRVRKYFPNNKIGSRIVVTTRLSNLASALPGPGSLEMKFLDEANSWDLLSKTVFGEKGCPIELENIGKRIGRNCKGLPLSIVVVGGLLAKSKHTRELWQYIEENLNAIVNMDDDERCLKILYLSYKHLPVYLKPCFLYMGVFSEDDAIRISRLVKLWVAEGFLKPVIGKTLEEIAKEYLKDLIGRNLILIDEMGSTGNIKCCKIHDLLRDLCLREAKKERFYTVSLGGQVNRRRGIITSKFEDINILSVAPSWRLLRILDSSRSWSAVNTKFLENMHQLVNSRFLAFSNQSPGCIFPSSIWLFWNLQTLIVTHSTWVIVLTDLWYMPLLRHVEFQQLYLPDPPHTQDGIVLRNLQALVGIVNFKCSERVVKRIPNVKKLQVVNLGFDDDRYCLRNLDCLYKLESLNCTIYSEVNPISFPHSLKKLSLHMEESHCWEELLDKVGVLPLLQKLTLSGGRFKEGQWETSEGQFHSLKFLALRECKSLQMWTSESSHFPCLEFLLLDQVDNLKEIPLDFAEIPTLGVIHVSLCRDSVKVSAKRILEEQEELYGEATIQIRP